jgi:hypothetical protein
MEARAVVVVPQMAERGPTRRLPADDGRRSPAPPEAKPDVGARTEATDSSTSCSREPEVSVIGAGTDDRKHRAVSGVSITSVLSPHQPVPLTTVPECR